MWMSGRRYHSTNASAVVSEQRELMGEFLQSLDGSPVSSLQDLIAWNDLHTPESMPDRESSSMI